MTTEEKADLIAECNRTIKDAEAAGAGYRTVARGKIARIALSALTAEPVAVPDEYLEATQNDKGLFELSEDCMVRLAVALSQQQKGLVIKPGWKLVPVEPTDEQWQAAHGMFDVQRVYRAMIAAAPEPQK